jgi:hypothetical protein
VRIHPGWPGAETTYVNADAAVVTVTVEVGAAPHRPVGPLASTGADLDVLVVWALALIVVGVATLLLARIRLETPHA